MKSEKNEGHIVIGRFIKVRSQKVSALRAAYTLGILLIIPAFPLDAYLVHRWPRYFPHYGDFTMVFTALYFAIGLLWMHFSGVTKKTREQKIALVFMWGCVLGLGAMPWFSDYAVLPECVQNLWEIQTAKVDWMVANHKKEYDTPTWDDVKPYLQKRGWKDGIPVCPDGGKYTLGKVGERPTCSIGGYEHWLPSTVEARSPRSAIEKTGFPISNGRRPTNRYQHKSDDGH